MKTLYLECNMGAAGDMLMAALFELAPNPIEILDKLNSLGLPGVHVHVGPAAKCGIVGTHVDVHIHGEREESVDVHSHSHGNDAHGHTHDHGAHSHSHGNGEAHGHSHTCCGNHEHPHSHTHEQEGCTCQGQSHAHTHPHGHTQDHGHGHAHPHAQSHSHSALDDILHTISHLPVSEQVKKDAGAVYALIAEAESHSHGVPAAQIHFHEVGTLDAVMDVVGVCLLIEALAPEQILASPIHVGSGQVKCAHGVLPVPAPATAYILKDVPIYGGRIRGELCTPTGAALLKHFVTSFGDMPIMQTEGIGYGMGTKDFEFANCVRAYIGQTADNADSAIYEITCNLDDMTPEAIGYATDILFEAGALDVFTTSIQMKKNRPATLFTCLCREEATEALSKLILLHTTTIGVRTSRKERYTLATTSDTQETSYGNVRIKRAKGYGIEKAKPEYDDIARIAKEEGLPFHAVYQTVLDQLKCE